MRPNTVKGSVDSVTWGFDSTVLFIRGADDYILSVDNSGAVKSGLRYFLNNIHRDAFTRRIYSDAGDVFDANGQHAGFISFVRGPVAPDGALGKDFFGTRANSQVGVGAAGLSGQGVAPPALALGPDDVPTRLLRWGVNGLALATRSRVYVYSGMFVQ
jgi:hypothetical protein